MKRLPLPLILILLTTAATAAPPTARELEQKVLAYRRGLKSGHVVIRESNTKYRNGPAYLKIVRTYDLTFDGLKVRSLATWTSPKNERVTRNISTESGAIENDYEDMPVIMKRTNEPETRSKDAVHPWLLGLINGPISSFSSSTLDETFRFSKGIAEPTVIATRVGSDPAWQIVYDHPSIDLRASVVVVPNFGYGVTSIVFEHVTKTGQRLPLDITTADYRAYGKHWYPSKVVYRQHGKQGLAREEIMEVSSADFNISVDPNTFEIAGLGLPVGREVTTTDRFATVWNGDRLIPDYGLVANKPKNPGVPVRPPTRWPWWLATIACVAVVSAILARRVGRGRR